MKEGFVGLLGPDTKTMVDLTAVVGIHYNSKDDVMMLILPGGGSVSQGGLSEEARERIIASWMAMRRKK